MHYLFARLDEIKKTIKGKVIIIFLDYDGTLTPIVKNPEAAVIAAGKKELLRKLSKNKMCKVAVISGRSLADIKNKIGLSNIIYSGNHGLEISGPKFKFKVPVSREYKVILREIKNQLKKKFSFVRGILLEDKGLCLALHYRLVNKNQIPLVESGFKEVTSPYLLKHKIEIKPGKMVFDIKPALRWDKGKAVLQLLSRQKAFLRGKAILPIYIGDDKTDEDAFRVLRNNSLTIFVGKPKKSYAGFYLKNTNEVFKLLKIIEEF